MDERIYHFSVSSFSTFLQQDLTCIEKSFQFFTYFFRQYRQLHGPLGCNIASHSSSEKEFKLVSSKSVTKYYIPLVFSSLCSCVSSDMHAFFSLTWVMSSIDLIPAPIFLSSFFTYSTVAVCFVLI